jgi:predicted PurR-regulated permease PerM
MLLIITGVIGGLIGFGIIGLFIGPVILAVTFTLLRAWVSHGQDSVLEEMNTEPLTEKTEGQIQFQPRS